MRAGVIGLGMLGGAVAARLCGAGQEVRAFNRTKAKAMELEGTGIAICGTPAQVARDSDLVITCVRDAGAIRDVSFGKHGIVHGAHEGLVVADMSTITPSESRAITAEFARHGITKIDVPVMGGPDAAAEGRLVMMVSGDRDAFERHRDTLGIVASKSHHIGGPGDAHATKLAMNLQITMLALGLSEGIALAQASGVGAEAFLGVLNSTYFKTGMSEKKAYRMARGECKATFTLENLAKDIGAMGRAASELGLELPMVSKAGELYGDAIKAGLGGLDYTGIIQHIRGINGAYPRGHGSTARRRP